MAVIEQFDRDSEKYLARHLTPEKLREKDRILDLVNHKKRYHRVLDIGCGPGTISKDLLGISEEVQGIDISGDMVRIAREKFKEPELCSRIHFDLGDAENLKFPNNHFDAVFCLGVLRYLDSWENGLKEIYRVLKPDGVIVVTFYSRYSLFWFSMVFLYRPLLPFISLIKRRTLKELINKYKAEPLPFSYKKFRSVFANTGFTHSVTFHSGMDMFPLNRLLPKLSRSIYLKTESAFHDSDILGWMGSICIVKGVKK